MKIKKNFEVCPICDGKGVVLNHSHNTLDDLEYVECTYCFFGVAIKDDLYQEIIDKLGIKYEDMVD